jgi:hypothetical protein
MVPPLREFHGVKILTRNSVERSAVSRQPSAFKGLFFNINRGIVNRKMKRSLAVFTRLRRGAEKRRESLLTGFAGLG